MLTIIVENGYGYLQEVMVTNSWEDYIPGFSEERYHESLGNVTPADMCFDRAKEIQSRREQIKQKR